MERNLAAFKQQLAEDSSIRTTFLKDQLDRQTSELRARLSEEMTIRTETLKDQLTTQSTFRVEGLKSELSQKVQMALEVARWRQSTYVSLWSMMEIVSIDHPIELTPAIRCQLANDLTSFYYKDGHALYLSAASTKHFLTARNLLRSKGNVSDAMIREEFSGLRTQMKVDLAVYSPDELYKQL
jgi:hypothetical protein